MREIRIPDLTGLRNELAGTKFQDKSKVCVQDKQDLRKPLTRVCRIAKARLLQDGTDLGGTQVSDLSIESLPVLEDGPDPVFALALKVPAQSLGQGLHEPCGIA